MADLTLTTFTSAGPVRLAGNAVTLAIQHTDTKWYAVTLPTLYESPPPDDASDPPGTITPLASAGPFDTAAEAIAAMETLP